jgi:lysophospholipase L1-like esterase
MHGARRILGAAGGALLLALGVWAVTRGSVDNTAVLFYAGVAGIGIGAPLLVHGGLPRAPVVLGILANTLASLAVGLMLLEGGWALLRTAPEPSAAPLLRFDEGRWDPEQLRAWQDRVLRDWFRMLNTLVRFDPSHAYPVVPIPNRTVTFFESEYRINRLGLRGDEVTVDKGDAYRVMAIGESTTFGATVAASDRPWPEVLEERIVATLDCDREIEVVNAGMGTWNLAHSLRRLEGELLPLEPDLVISYHGHNGFKFILRDLPPVAVPEPPIYPKRPSRLVARIEFSIKLRKFRRWYRYEGQVDADLDRQALMDTEYANLYRRFIDLARREGFVPVIGTFNMAVNAETPEEVVEFFALTHPMVRPLQVANALHTPLVHALGEAEDVIIVDTSAGLDGAYQDQFIDLVHFTQSGRDRLAEHFLAGITPVLLAEPSLGCALRGGEAPDRS